jgi:hypothetical protein
MVLGERAKKALQIQPNICKPMNSAPERQHDFSRPAARQQFTAVLKARADGVLKAKARCADWPLLFRAGHTISSLDIGVFAGIEKTNERWKEGGKHVITGGRLRLLKRWQNALGDRRFTCLGVTSASVGRQAFRRFHSSRP